MAIFNSYVSLPEGICRVKELDSPVETTSFSWGIVWVIPNAICTHHPPYINHSQSWVVNMAFRLVVQ